MTPEQAQEIRRRIAEPAPWWQRALRWTEGAAEGFAIVTLGLAIASAIAVFMVVVLVVAVVGQILNEGVRRHAGVVAMAGALVIATWLIIRAVAP